MQLPRCMWFVALATAGCLAAGQSRVPYGPEETELASSLVLGTEVSRALTAFAPPRSSGIGYVWLGYCGTDVPVGELNEFGSGDGFSFGAGFRVGDSARAFVELAWEKTLKHASPATLSDPTPPSGLHERTMIGGRTAAAALARLAHQPKPYMTYGLAYENFRVNYATTTDYRANALGYYLGLGVEFPFAEGTSLNFDAKYHLWTGEDNTGEEGMFGSIAFSILWLSRF